ncbi:hypothetical protein ACFC1T_26065 [Kitasatospora sp. NPDC056076]|uniref:hypothetical protein n=1 Tax=Kitasatospora sp. NPDC056076 TaxID=3345703 RepID=UPI0035E33FAE
MPADRNRPARRRHRCDVGFTAFVALQEEGYLRYAQARLGDRALSLAAVELALERVEVHWESALSQERPGAYAWCILRAAVAAALGAVPSATRGDRLHPALPPTPADVALLHHDLGMPVGKAAQLMGVDEPEVRLGLMTARRLLATSSAPVGRKDFSKL